MSPLRDQVARVALALRLRVTDGKEVVEVRPASRVDKGTAVVTMGERLDGFDAGASIVFAGDDRTESRSPPRLVLAAMRGPDDQNGFQSSLDRFERYMRSADRKDI